MEAPQRSSYAGDAAHKELQTHVVEVRRSNENISTEKLPLYKRLMEEMWLFEFFALGVSIVALAGMIIMLGITNGEPVPNWQIHPPHTKPLTVTLNSVISIFSTVVKSTVLIPVVASLGELKWLWFRKGRRLADVQVYDSCAKGPLGASVLIWTFRGKTLACLGAIIIIGSLALDFAFQQLVTFPLRPVNVSQATILRTSGYSEIAAGPLGTVRNAAPGMVAAVYRGMYGGSPNFTVTPFCATGNCTWTEYTSLGVCSSCYSTTDLLEKQCGNYTITEVDEAGNEKPSGDPVPYCNVTFPGTSRSSGQIMPGILPTTAMLVNVASGAASNQSYYGQDLVAHLGVMSIIRGDWRWNPDRAYYELVDANATECGLDLCAIRYAGAVNNSVFTETTIDTFVNTTSFWAPGGMPSYDVLTPANWSTSSAESFAVDPFALSGLQSLFISGGDHPTLWEGTYNSTLEFGQTTSTNDLVSYLRFLNDTGVSDTMRGLAASMTTRMRTSPGDGTNLPEEGGPGPAATGFATQDLPHVNVRWGWLALPGTLLGLSALFLATTVLITKRQGAKMLWKSNTLAHFYHPLSQDGTERLQGATSAKEAEKIAKDLRVKWQETEEGGRFVTA